MKEASDGKAIFEDILEETFIRFCQFAHTGEYTTPDFTQIREVLLLLTSENLVLFHYRQ